MRKEKAITLVSLVVTIIVLVILAGVSINLVLGENGIITKSKQAKVKAEQATLNEQIALNELYVQMEAEDMGLGGTSNSAIAKLVEFKKEIASAISDMGVPTAENADASTMSNNIRSISGASSADKVSYDNTNSGLTATNVQGAVDEVNSKIQEDEWKSVEVNLSVSSVSTSYTTKIVPELIGAKEVYYIFCVNETAHFLNFGDGVYSDTFIFTNSSFDSTDVWNGVSNTFVNFSNGEVGLRMNVKGSLQSFPSISKIYYR